MDERRFRFVATDDALRQFNRQQYKEVSRYLRIITRLIHKRINWQKFDKHLLDTMILGYSQIKFDDLLKPL